MSLLKKISFLGLSFLPSIALCDSPIVIDYLVSGNLAKVSIKNSGFAFRSTGHYQQQMYEADGYSYLINNVDVFKKLDASNESVIQSNTPNWRSSWSNARNGISFVTENVGGVMTKGIDITASYSFMAESGVSYLFGFSPILEVKSCAKEASGVAARVQYYGYNGNGKVLLGENSSKYYIAPNTYTPVEINTRVTGIPLNGQYNRIDAKLTVYGGCEWIFKGSAHGFLSVM